MRRKLKILFTLFVLACITGRMAWAVSSKEATGAVFAASDGHGEFRLIWFPPLGKWPSGGWQVQDASGKVLVDRIQAEAPQAMARLQEEGRVSIAKLMGVLRKATSERETAPLYGMLGARAFGQWDFAQAVGLACEFRLGASGRQTFRLVGLAANGNPSGVRLVSQPVDAGVATPLPPAPQMLRAESVDGGVALFWQPAPPDRLHPVLAYSVERDGVAATSQPLILPMAWPAMKPAMVDRNAPLESEVHYRVQAWDIFGRRGMPAEVKLFAVDLSALQPPLDFFAEAGKEEVKLAWTPSKNPHTAGYVVERSYLPEGPFEAITPEAVRAGDDTYVDRKLQGGTAYIYRLRAMGARGDLGPPSRTVVAQPEAKNAPPRVEGLKAESGRTRVRLEWQPLVEPVAGYFVERQAKDGDVWMRLTPRPVQEPAYDDYAVAEMGGVVRYRVLAVGLDNKLGRTSSELSVKLLNLDVPPPPYIVRIDGADGRVRLTFSPSGDAARVARYLLLRGDNPNPEIVLGEPLPGSARQFEDTFVEPGESYWYRLVAVDAQGNRSEPGAAVVVRVGSPEVATAPRPEVAYEAEPFPHAVLRYADPPLGLKIQLQYHQEGRPWMILAGPVGTGGVTTQANLPSGVIEYRSVYVAADGKEGTPSEAVQLKRP